MLWQQGPLGTSLVDAVRECRGIDDRVALANRVVGTVLRTLRAVHAADIVHCDVRPANIVMGRNGDAYLVDWGLSCARGTNATRCGVAAYAAPVSPSLLGRVSPSLLGRVCYGQLRARLLPVLG